MTTGKRSKAAVLTKEVVEQANICLQNLPEKKDNRSLEDTLQPFQPQIQAALSQGSSYDDVAVLLSQQGINLSGARLKQYISDGTGSSSKSSKRSQTAKKTTKRSTSSKSKRGQTNN
jgi:phage gp29-like protein